MRVNEKELAFVAGLQSDREGRLSYRSPNSFRDGYKERWFKLKGNLMFYYRLNEYGGVYEQEPVGVFVLENCRIQLEQNEDLPFAFSIVFKDDEGKKHMFYGPNSQNCELWVKTLTEASYECLRSKAQMLRLKIQQRQALQQEPKQLYRSIPHDVKLKASDINLMQY